MFVRNVNLDGVSLDFLTFRDLQEHKEDNYFTILIGKNASGKSEILKEICHLLIRSQIKDDYRSLYVDSLDYYLDRNYKDLLHRGDRNVNCNLVLYNGREPQTYSYIRTDEKRKFVNFKGEIEYIEENVFRHFFAVTNDQAKVESLIDKINIVAVSSGQFDKFPVLQSMGISSGTGIKYSYVGVQNDRLSSKYDSILALKVGEIGLSILKFCIESKKVNLNSLFATLGFSGKVKITYEVKSHLLSRDVTEPEMLSIAGVSYSSIGLGSGQDTLTSTDIDSIKNSLQYFSKIQDQCNELPKFNDNDRYMSVDLDLFTDSETTLVKNLYYVAKVNALSIKDVSFERGEGSSSLALASSGQINLLNIFLGIASCIKNNSLILIDEPEISLHADWQMKFMPMLQDVFACYTGCHYIVATHAPMIISNADSTCSSILNMNTGITESVSIFEKQSSDYLNAYLFETPGHKNETMNREVVSLLSAISKRKKLSEVQLGKAERLIKWSSTLNIDDPIKDLVDILKEALEVYLND
jgi:predicted ATPase